MDNKELIKLQQQLIDIWGNNEFPDLALGVMGHHILNYTFKVYEGLDTLDMWCDSPLKREDIQPDQYMLMTYDFGEINAPELLKVETLNRLTIYIHNKLRNLSEYGNKVWRGTLRLHFAFTLDQNTINPVVMFMLRSE